MRNGTLKREEADDADEDSIDDSEDDEELNDRFWSPPDSNNDRRMTLNIGIGGNRKTNPKSVNHTFKIYGYTLKPDNEGVFVLTLQTSRTGYHKGKCYADLVEIRFKKLLEILVLEEYHGQQFQQQMFVIEIDDVVGPMPVDDQASQFPVDEQRT